MTTQATLVTAEALARLALARGAAADERVGDVYLEALADLDADVVRRACGRLAKLPRGEFETALPSVGTIREVCATITAEEADAQAKKLLGLKPKTDDSEPTFFCLDCHDEPNGWRIFQCRGSGEFAAEGDGPYRPCGHPKPHGTHPFAERCACLPHNPVIREAKERMRKHVIERDNRRTV